jgi:hypothetical protein
MESLTATQRSELADLQLRAAEIAEVSNSPFAATNKQYVDAQVLAADTRVSDILAGSQPAFDTLIELKTLLDSGDASLSTVLTSQIGTETTRRTAADVALGSRIDAEAIARAAAISSEASARSSADNTLTASIATVSSTVAALSSKQSSDNTARLDEITSESSRAQGAEISLSSSIEDESFARATAVGQVQSNLDGEVILRGEAVGQVQSNLDGEVILREEAVGQVQSALGDEVVLRGEETEALRVDKFDRSEQYSKRDDGNFAVSGDAFLYIGTHWRIRANDGGSKRLEFEYSSDASLANFKTAVPFIRGA